MSEIKSIKIHEQFKVGDDTLVFNNVEDLKTAYDMMINNENFILSADGQDSLIIADRYLARVNNGELVLLANKK